MEINKCFYCMSDMPANAAACPHCGKRISETPQPEFALPMGTILHGKYLIGAVLGQGGFGLTYIGFDLMLGIKVAVKEYFPSSMAARSRSGSVLWSSRGIPREEGCQNFLKEARKMAKLMDIPEVVRVQDIVMENDTAYIVMEFVEGITLKDSLKKTGPMPADRLLSLLGPVAGALDRVHKDGIIHRDISPDNIMIDRKGQAKLLDLGAAKELDMRSDRDKQSSQLIHKDGFSPPEQYTSGSSIGPWTDVYAMAATVYYCMTGHLVPSAMDRLYNETEIAFPAGFPENIRKALLKGLALKTKDRYQTVGALWAAMEAKPVPKPEPPKPVSVPEPVPVPEHVPMPEPVAAPAVKPKQEAAAEIEAGQKHKKGRRKIIPGIAAVIIVGVMIAAAIVIFSGTTAGTLNAADCENYAFMGDAQRLSGKNIAVFGCQELTRGQILSIEFVKSENLPACCNNDNVISWDASASHTGHIMAYAVPSTGMYDLYIAADSSIKLCKDASYIFASFTKVRSISFNGILDTSGTEDMSGMFIYCTNLTTLDLSGFDTANVTDMASMFKGCENLTNLDLSSFDTANVTDMAYMFYGCENLTSLDLSSFDTTNVINMHCMFNGCENLTSLDLSGFNTSNVWNMAYMFAGCTKLTSLDLSSFDTTSLQDSTEMFSGCDNLQNADTNRFYATADK